MRWIFRLIGAFFSFVWRLFWRLVWIVVLLCALAFELLWYLNGGFSRSAGASRTVSQDWSTKY